MLNDASFAQQLQFLTQYDSVLIGCQMHHQSACST